MENQTRADDTRQDTDEEDLQRRFLLDREITHLSYLAEIVADAENRVLLRGARIDFERVSDLYERGFESFQQLNDARTEFEALQARIAEHQHVLARGKKSFENADTRWYEFVEREDASVAYDAVLTPLRLAADVRRRELNQVVSRIDDHVIRSPITGQITALFARRGDHLPIGSQLVTISPTKTDRIVAYLPEHRASAAWKGQSVRVVRLDTTLPNAAAYDATVDSLSAVISEAPLRFRTVPTQPAWGRELIVALSNGAILTPGEPVSVTLLPSPR